MRFASATDRAPVLIFGAMLAVALWSLSLSWNGPLLDRHEFRQTETAISAYWLRQDDFKLDYETPIFGPPWSVPFEFPVYQVSVAWFSRITGVPLEPSGRATSVLYFLATLPAVYLLAGFFSLSPSQRLLVVAAVLSSPVYLFYGRSFMIETTALCFSAWFLVATGRAIKELDGRWAVVAALTGSLAALAKVTTFAVYCFPAGGLALWLIWPRWRQRAKGGTGWLHAILLAAAPVALAVTLGAWWVAHGDAVKASNPFSSVMKSSDLHAWTWGTLALRTSPDFWREAWDNLTDNILSAPALGVVLPGAFLATRPIRLAALAGTAAFLAGPLLFSNLYERHDYYYTANALLLLAAAGGILADASRPSRLPRALVQSVVLLFFAAQLHAFYRSYGSYHRRELPRPPEISRVIRAVTDPGDVILIYGWDWNTLVPYYAERRAVMVPSGREHELPPLEAVLDRLAPRRIRALLVKAENRDGWVDLVRDRVADLGLAPATFAASADGDLYLAPEMLGRAAADTAHGSFPGVDFHPVPPAAAGEAEWIESDLRPALFPVINPGPVRARSAYGLAMGQLDGRPVLIANAPSELWLPAPAGAATLTAEFGLVPDAYAGEPRTDGVGLTIFELRPGGIRREIFRRELDPVARPADRGPQHLTLPIPGHAGARLFLRVDPGPAGGRAKDWFYWARLDLR